jgi:hypothetical protein
MNFQEFLQNFHMHHSPSKADNHNTNEVSLYMSEVTIHPTKAALKQHFNTKCTAYNLLEVLLNLDNVLHTLQM